MKIIAWTYEADIHCEGCTVNRFGIEAINDNNDVSDNEGNPVHPVFTGAEIDYEPNCGSCHTPIEGMTILGCER